MTLGEILDFDELLKSTNECQISIQDGAKHDENHIVHDNELVEELS